MVFGSIVKGNIWDTACLELGWIYLDSHKAQRRQRLARTELNAKQSDTAPYQFKSTLFYPGRDATRVS